MPNGRLGAADLSAATNTTIYTVPVSTTATFNVSICNRNNGPIAVRLALASSGTPVASEYIEYEAVIEGNGVLERTGLVLDPSKLLVAFSDTANVSVVAYGYEEV